MDLLFYSKNIAILSSNICYENKEWKIKDGKNISTKFISPEIEEITFMCRIEDYHCTHKDRILTGFSNGYISLFKFNSSVCN